MDQTLAQALPHEMARVRDKILPEYLKIPTGVFAAAMMRADLDRAAKALAEQDTVSMLQCYESLRGYTL